MIAALLWGILVGPFFRATRFAPGVEFSSREILRVGVALLGFRIAFTDVASHGWVTPAIVLICVGVGLFSAIVIGRMLGQSPKIAFLIGCGVSICGVSAILAVSSILHLDKRDEAALSSVICGVFVLSAAAMIMYPMISAQLGLSADQAGLLLGGAIHDVAQSVGAAYSVSEEVGDTAIYVKLTRVALLAPLVVVASIIWPERTGSGVVTAGGAIPIFLIGFIAAATINSTGIAPRLCDIGAWLAIPCLVIAISAIGMKTDIGAVFRSGARPMAVVASVSLVLAIAVLTSAYIAL